MFRKLWEFSLKLAGLELHCSFFTALIFLRNWWVCVNCISVPRQSSSVECWNWKWSWNVGKMIDGLPRYANMRVQSSKRVIQWNRNPKWTPTELPISTFHHIEPLSRIRINFALVFRLTHQKCKKIYELKKKWKNHLTWHTQEEVERERERRWKMFIYFPSESIFSHLLRLWYSRNGMPEESTRLSLMLNACLTVFFLFLSTLRYTRAAAQPPTLAFIKHFRKHKRRLSNNIERASRSCSSVFTERGEGLIFAILHEHLFLS